jgi:FixJ family two-component response regulator
MNDKATVFVVDDDMAALESLRWMLQQANLRVKALRSAREFLDAYRPEETGCLVLDVRMPDMDGLALQETLQARNIRLPIIFVTAHGDVPTCAAAFRRGAVDFLEKPVDDKLLLEHIKKLTAGDTESGCREAGFDDRIRRLTPTEAEVLDALIRGKSIKDIAHARKVSVQTVWRHQSNIFQKIGVKNHVELVRAATQWRIQQGE